MDWLVCDQGLFSVGFKCVVDSCLSDVLGKNLPPSLVLFPLNALVKRHMMHVHYVSFTIFIEDLVTRYIQVLLVTNTHLFSLTVYFNVYV